MRISSVFKAPCVSLSYPRGQRPHTLPTLSGLWRTNPCLGTDRRHRPPFRASRGAATDAHDQTGTDSELVIAGHLDVAVAVDHVVAVGHGLLPGKEFRLTSWDYIVRFRAAREGTGGPGTRRAESAPRGDPDPIDR